MQLAIWTLQDPPQRKFSNLINYSRILRLYKIGLGGNSKAKLATSTDWLMIPSLKWLYFNDKHLKKNVFVEKFTH